MMCQTKEHEGKDDDKYKDDGFYFEGGFSQIFIFTTNLNPHALKTLPQSSSTSM